MAKTSNKTNLGVGGPDWAVDRVAGIDYQYLKLAHGPEGTVTETAEATPVPVKAHRGLDAGSVVAGVINMAASATALSSVVARSFRLKNIGVGDIVLGPSGVTLTTGWILSPGEVFPPGGGRLELANLNAIFALSDVAHDANNKRQLAYFGEV